MTNGEQLRDRNARIQFQGHKEYDVMEDRIQNMKNLR